MTKKKVEKPRREVTKRQLSLWQRQKRRQRLILGSGIFIIVAALSVSAAGWYIGQYKPMHEIVIRVNDTSFNMNYYVKTLKYYGEGQSSYYIAYLADEAVKIIEQNELVRQEATELGISVSDSEVDKELKSRDPPLSRDYRDLVRAEMLISKLQDEYFEPKVPVSAEQRHIMAMLLESKSQALETRAKLERNESFSELAGELSLESYSRLNEGDLDWLPKGILPILLGTPIIDDYAFSSEAGALSQPLYDEEINKNVGYWIIKVSERKEETEEAHVQAILSGSEKEAQRIRDRLEAGEDFAALAAESSQYGESEENNGDLGWVTPDMVSSAFGEFAFNFEMELETLSEPIRDELVTTKGGYWLVKVLDKVDDRQIEDANRDLLKVNLLDEWIETLWDDPENKVEDFLDDEKKSWAIEQVIMS